MTTATRQEKNTVSRQFIMAGLTAEVSAIPSRNGWTVIILISRADTMAVGVVYRMTGLSNWAVMAEFSATVSEIEAADARGWFEAARKAQII